MQSTSPERGSIVIVGPFMRLQKNNGQVYSISESAGADVFHETSILVASIKGAKQPKDHEVPKLSLKKLGFNITTSGLRENVTFTLFGKSCLHPKTWIKLWTWNGNASKVEEGVAEPTSKWKDVRQDGAYTYQALYYFEATDSDGRTAKSEPFLWWSNEDKAQVHNIEWPALTLSRKEEIEGGLNLILRPKAPPSSNKRLAKGGCKPSPLIRIDEAITTVAGMFANMSIDANFLEDGKENDVDTSANAFEEALLKMAKGDPHTKKEGLEASIQIVVRKAASSIKKPPEADAPASPLQSQIESSQVNELQKIIAQSMKCDPGISTITNLMLDLSKKVDYLKSILDQHNIQYEMEPNNSLEEIEKLLITPPLSNPMNSNVEYQEILQSLSGQPSESSPLS